MSGPLRITMKLTELDDPILYAALLAIPKGVRRVARLRALAHDALLLQGREPALTSSAPTPGADEILCQAGNELFDNQ